MESLGRQPLGVAGAREDPAHACMAHRQTNAGTIVPAFAHLSI